MEQFKDTMEKPEIIRIGKNLLSDGIVKQIKDLVKNRRIIKVKILKTAYDYKSKENIVAELLSITDTHLLDVRGNTFIISKRTIPGLKVSNKCREITKIAKTLVHENKDKTNSD